MKNIAVTWPLSERDEALISEDWITFEALLRGEIEKNLAEFMRDENEKLEQRILYGDGETEPTGRIILDAPLNISAGKGKRRGKK